MQFERFTISASKRLQEAQTMAISNGNAILESGHLLLSVLGAQDSISMEILSRMKVDTDMLYQKLNFLVSSYPKIES
jgi:ATP-dependent Clp protease ATP-binding subunit ClpA